MPAPSFALVTPSFAPDFERCALLTESVAKHVPESVAHYIIVDRRDERLFSKLRARRTHVVCKQDILPGWLKQIPRSKNWWLNLRGFPVRGWIIQQLTKLSSPAASNDDVFVFLDSDTFFVKPYDPQTFLRGDLVPMFRQLREHPEDPNHVQWYTVAARVLGIPAQKIYEPSYVTQLVTWRRDNVLKMYERIEQVSGRSWIDTLCREGWLGNRFGEYVFYGVFCEQILKERSGHYFDPEMYSLNYWSNEVLDEAGVRKLKSELQPHHHAVMISAKSHTPVSIIRRVFEL